MRFFSVAGHDRARFLGTHCRHDCARRGAAARRVAGATRVPAATERRPCGRRCGRRLALCRRCSHVATSALCARWRSGVRGQARSPRALGRERGDRLAARPSRRAAAGGCTHRRGCQFPRVCARAPPPPAAASRHRLVLRRLPTRNAGATVASTGCTTPRRRARRPTAVTSPSWCDKRRRGRGPRRGQPRVHEGDVPGLLGPAERESHRDRGASPARSRRRTRDSSGWIHASQPPAGSSASPRRRPHSRRRCA